MLSTAPKIRGRAILVAVPDRGQVVLRVCLTEREQYRRLHLRASCYFCNGEQHISRNTNASMREGKTNLSRASVTQDLSHTLVGFARPDKRAYQTVEFAARCTHACRIVKVDSDLNHSA